MPPERNFDSTIPQPWSVSVLGPLGTFTHEAAHSQFGSNVTYDEQDTIEGVFEAVYSSSQVGVVPQENSIFGAVTETYDALRGMGFVKGTITLKIQHCLVARCGAKLGDIQKIFSHEQALGQCRDFIRLHLPRASLIKTSSTAAAAHAILDQPLHCAAICSRVCIGLFTGLSVLCDGIQDALDNLTRFYILARDDGVKTPPLPSQFGHALLRIPMEHFTIQSNSPDISQLLSVLHMAIVRVDRRPSSKRVPYHNVYFVELESKQPPSTNISWRKEVEQSLERVHQRGGDVHLIGLW